MTLEFLLKFIIGLMCFHSLTEIYDSIKRGIDWNGEERLKKDLERRKRQLESSTEYLDDVYTVKLFCEFMSKKYLELLNKILKEDYEQSKEFIEDFNSQYFYYVKFRDVGHLIDKWNMTQYGEPLTDRYGYLNVDLNEVLESTKINEVYFGCSLEDLEEEELANGHQKILELLNHIDEELVEDVVERNERDKEYLYKLKTKM